jgi:hypothetical protein
LDEAFAWVIMDSYYNRWKENTTEKAGAKVGVTETVGKKKGAFLEYAMSAVNARKTPNATLWSEKLQEIMRKEMMANKENDEDEGYDSPADDDKEDEGDDLSNERDYVKETSNQLGDDSGDSDNDDDEDENEDEDGGNSK